MDVIETRHHRIGPGSPCYTIAEIGSNHGGDPELAMALIRAAAQAGARAVKFQKRDNATLFHPEFAARPYPGPNSHGPTYLAHREALEPRIEWLGEANRLAHSLGLDFIVTCFDKSSLALCASQLSVDLFKIQSADSTHHSFIRETAAVGRPLLISFGASTWEQVLALGGLAEVLPVPSVMLYAVCSYPSSDAQMNLSRITQIQAALPGKMLGLSCHHPGIETATLARALGITCLEKHFTLSRDMRGTDHAFSLTPKDWAKMEQALARTDLILGEQYQRGTEIAPYERDARRKLGKSPVWVCDLPAGTLVGEAHVRWVSPGEGIDYGTWQQVLGSALCRDVQRDAYVQPTDAPPA